MKYKLFFCIAKEKNEIKGKESGVFFFKQVDFPALVDYTSLRIFKGGFWGYSSVGRALPLQGRCQRFEPAYLHKYVMVLEKMKMTGT